jgi:hypothetical protein
MQPNSQPKLNPPRSIVVIDAKPSDLPPPPESRASANILSVPPRPSARPSGPPSMRSLRPIAASLRPEPRSIFPSEDASAELPTRRRRALGTVAVATILAVAGAGALRHHGTVTSPHPLIEEVVSGRAGLRTTPSGIDEHWASATPPAFVLDPSLAKIDKKANEAIIDAFSTWDSSGLGLPRASFTISSTAGAAKQDGVSRIVYAPITISGREEALAITIAYADPSNGQIKEADIIFNSKYTFEVFPGGSGAAPGKCDGHYDVQNVATHEAGHVYGLGEDTTDQTTTMYITSESCETHKRALTTTDQSVMTSLYAQAKAESSSSTSAAESTSSGSAGGCGGATIASRGPSSGGVAWVLSGLAALIPLRRRRGFSGRHAPPRREKA